MMLMTKFGKFKLRLVATINIGVLLSIFNIASTTSNYWIKYRQTNSPHPIYAGLWRSCPPHGECTWMNGITDVYHSFWSIFVRVFISFGTVINSLAVFFLIMALFYKINKRSKCAISFMELGNCMFLSAFIIIIIGFCVFVSTSCNFSMWLHIASIILILCTSNMMTRTFATLYFKNTRLQNMKSVETAISTMKLPQEDEKIALNTISTESEQPKQVEVNTENKTSTQNGSSEALIQGTEVKVESN
jgi:hypothetical protein